MFAESEVRLARNWGCEVTEGEFRLIETMRADGHVIALLDRHLARLQASCTHFGFRFDPEAIRVLICGLCETLASDRSHRLRLTVNRSGRIQVTIAPIDSDDRPETPRVAFSLSRVDPGDVFLYHKTTRRELYDSEWLEAQTRGVYEVLYLNTRDEVAEGSRTNIFVEIDGELATPPVSCGLLPGIYRSHVLESRPSCVERILSLQDLTQADAIYLCNAVTGLVQVRLIDSRAAITESDDNK